MILLVISWGVGTTVKEDSVFNTVLLRGYETTYIIPKDDDQNSVAGNGGGCHKDNFIDGLVSGVGDKLSLISALQARNGARVIFSGSSEFFSDDFLRRSPANLQMVQNLGEWFLNRRGQVRVKELRDHKLQGKEQEMYSIRDSLV